MCTWKDERVIREEEVLSCVMPGGLSLNFTELHLIWHVVVVVVVVVVVSRSRLTETASSRSASAAAPCWSAPGRCRRTAPRPP